MCRARLMRVEELHKALDQTLLDKGLGPEAIMRVCAEVRESHVATLCTLPEHLPTVVRELQGCDVKAAVSVDFPSGAHGTAERVGAVEWAVSEGAEEIDIVLNYRGMLAGEFGAVRDDLARVVRAVRSRSANHARGGVLVTVTLEAPRLGEKLTRLACRIAADAGVDFATTCTGEGCVATVTDVEIMRDALPEGIAVRAAGGVTTLDEVRDLVAAGAARVASDRTTAVLEALAEFNGGGK